MRAVVPLLLILLVLFFELPSLLGQLVLQCLALLRGQHGIQFAAHLSEQNDDFGRVRGRASVASGIFATSCP